MATVVQIVFDNGEWTVEPKDHNANKTRYRQHKAKRKDRWSKRHPKKLLPSHDPIIMDESEEFLFECPANLPFAIGAQKNLDCDELFGAPNDPFEWSTSQVADAGGTVTGKVKQGAVLQPGPKAQGFYKFYGWVYENGEFVPVDPDGYCG